MRSSWYLAAIGLQAVGLALALAKPASAQNDLSTVKARMLADAVTNAGFKAQTASYYGTDFTQVDAHVSSLTVVRGATCSANCWSPAANSAADTCCTKVA